MGEFSAGRWIVGLSLYFFIIFLTVFSAIGMANDYGLDRTGIATNDPGFNTPYNIPYGQTGECTGNIYGLCRYMNIDDNITCSQFAEYGCYWDNTTSFFSSPGCRGSFINWSSNTAPACEAFQTRGENICRLVGCTWTNFTGHGTGQTSGVTNNNFDWSSIKDTIGFMTGFRAEFGIPPMFNFIASFLFFWIPFFMLSWSVYMALPFLH
jgi:hypothetical protein